MSTNAMMYRIVWRWHFYAGLVVMPFLLILAVTGGIYLFNDEINDVVYHDLRFAPAVSKTSLPLSQLMDVALASYPDGHVTRIDTPREVGRTVEVFVNPAQGEPVRVFVDPGTGTVLGSYVYTHTLVGFADKFHGSLMLGKFGDAIVEIAACWAVILILTGLYLWWPRAGLRIVGVLLPRVSARGRNFWKSMHATIGVWTALFILFLIVSGLPWASVWGGMFREVINTAGVGYPGDYRTYGRIVSSSQSAPLDNPSGSRPWTLEGSATPASQHHHHGAQSLASMPGKSSQPIDVDAVAAIVAKNGMTDPYRLTLPADATGVYTALRYPDQPEGQRTLYIDQYSGEVLKDVKFSDYGWAAKAVELGVQIHMGNYFGRANQFIMLIPCVGILFLAVTGPYMWWLRRPKGRFAAPKTAGDLSLSSVLIGIILICAIFPLAGASLTVVLVGEAILQMLVRQRRSA